MNVEEPFVNQRAFYRLRFPADALLRVRISGTGLQTAGVDFWADEVSEKTLRVTSVVQQFDKPACCGVIYWQSASPSAFEGRLGPVRGRRQLILGVVGITLSDMVREQRRLIKQGSTYHRRHVLD